MRHTDFSVTNMHVAVIGSGASGLTAIKTCKEYNFDVTCYEQCEDIGGLWRYKETGDGNHSSVSKTTIMNTTKEMSSFSDFPPPKDFPNFMHNTTALKYLEMYAKEFDLIPHIKFSCRVESIAQAEDYDCTGKWDVKLEDVKNGEERHVIVDAVMVCTGHHCYPHIPKFVGEERFRNNIIHSLRYKKNTEYEDRTVAVVGIGSSGADIAVDISTVAKKVYLSTRRGCWIFRRVGRYGRPFNDTIVTRFRNTLNYVTSPNLLSSSLERELNEAFDHEAYQLKPNVRVHKQHPTMNDDLPNKILSGRIIVKGNVARFEENGVVFENENDVTEIDDVILATGYEIKFPFLNENVLDTTDNVVELYKFVFPPRLKHSTLGIIGAIQTVGSIFPIFEMQSRWFAEVITKKVRLPSRDEMYEDIRDKLNCMKKRFYQSPRHTIQVDFISYLDELASLIGAKPNYLKMLFVDPMLYWALMAGPSLPYQYRLRGPHSWSEARDTIMKYEKRVLAPFKTRFRNVKETETENKRNMFFVCVLSSFILFIVYQFLVFVPRI